eukprot:359636-Chlamydomonas_euryale.AAC.5
MDGLSGERGEPDQSIACRPGSRVYHQSSFFPPCPGAPTDVKPIWFPRCFQDNAHSPASVSPRLMFGRTGGRSG